MQAKTDGLLEGDTRNELTRKVNWMANISYVI
jgi:hypothetical protein